MSFELFRRALRSARLIVAPALLAGAFSVALALGMVALDLYHRLQLDLTAMQARTAKVLDGIDEVLKATAPQVAGLDCPQAIDKLRYYAAFDHRVRSLALIDGERVYCTSLFPGDDYRLADVADRDSPIRLLAGTPRWPKSPALTMRHGHADGGVLAFVSSRSLVTAMPASGPGSTLIHIGDSALPGSAEPPSARRTEVWIQASLPVRPGVRVERLVDRTQVLARLAEVWPLVLGAAVAAMGLAGGLYGRAYRRGGVFPNQLRLALARRQLVPFYQPLVSSAAGHPVLGFEVLMRWKKPGEGLILPADFLPAAERTGLILPMTDALMERVMVDVQGSAVLQGRMLGLNLAAAHLRDSPRILALAERFNQGARGTKARLTLEISERSIRADLAACRATLERVKAMGVHLSVDDFCTGNANLDTLCEMRFDIVKCDGFIAGLVNCGDQRQVIPGGMVELIHRLGFDVVVEGIETAEQAEFFAMRGVRLMQGFYFGRPMPTEDLATWLAGHEARFAVARAAAAVGGP